jgi:LysM repeat protein
MKITKIFGIVLSLHVGVILLVMFQPSCNTLKKGRGDQNGTTETSPSETGVDPAFNAGTETDAPPVVSVPETATGPRSSPTRPDPGELIVPGGPEGIVNPATGDVTGVGLRPEGLGVYKIAKGDTLWGIARKNNVSLNSLLGANPGLNKNASLSIGQEVLVPGVGSSVTEVTGSPSAPEPTVVSPGSTSYVVKKGDNLTRIASVHGVTIQAVRNANGLSRDTLQIGQNLVIPAGGSIPSTPTPIPVPVPSLGGNNHTVRSGDNLSRIAVTYGTTVAKLMELNGLTNANSIRVGQVLAVSGATPSPIPLVPASVDPAPPSVDPSPVTPDPNLEDFFNNDNPPVVDDPEE